jgi:hypothetical protein
MHILPRIIVVGLIGAGLICYCQEKAIEKVEQPKALLKEVGSTIESAPPPAKQGVTVYNKLSLDALPYKHWSGTHKPTELKLYINGELVTEYDSKKDSFTKHIQTINLPADKDVIKIRHVYDWTKYGICYAQGDKTKEIKIEPGTESVDLEFSWLLQEPGKEHIKLIQNKPIKEEKKEKREKTADHEAAV